MALPDSLSYGLTAPTAFERVAQGKWILNDSTVDQPIYFQVNSTVRPEADSDFVVRYDMAVNRPDPLPDAKMSVYLVARYNTKTFGEAPILNAANFIHSALTASGVLKRIMRGER